MAEVAIDPAWQCEVRHVLYLRTLGKSAVDGYLAVIERKHGAAEAAKLKADAADQWGKGNRGQGRDWK